MTSSGPLYQLLLMVTDTPCVAPALSAGLHSHCYVMTRVWADRLVHGPAQVCPELSGHICPGNIKANAWPGVTSRKHACVSNTLNGLRIKLNACFHFSFFGTPLFSEHVSMTDGQKGKRKDRLGLRCYGGDIGRLNDIYDLFLMTFINV